jgi:hypothetical protein
MMAQRKLNVRSLITHRIPVEESLRAYEIITGKAQEPYLGVLIPYSDTSVPLALSRRIDLRPASRPASGRKAVLGFIGAGNFTQSTLLPALMKLAPRMRGLATGKPVNAKNIAKKYHFEFCATDAGESIHDKEVNLIFVTSRHDSHAHYVAQALRAGKNGFVEKPLAPEPGRTGLHPCGLRRGGAGGTSPLLMVGYNRRFSEPARAIQRIFAVNTLDAVSRSGRTLYRRRRPLCRLDAIPVWSTAH